MNDYSPEFKISLIYPPIELCTGMILLTFARQRLTSTSDNAAMIGWASMYKFLAGDYDDYSVELRSKWSIETLPDGPSRLLDQCLLD